MVNAKTGKQASNTIGISISAIFFENRKIAKTGVECNHVAGIQG
jgi:hypothetical protein